MTVDSAGFWTQHGSHAVLIVGPVLAFAVLAVGADIYAWLRRDSRRLDTTASAGMRVAATLSAAAALIHGVVCPEHFREAAVYGIFFAVTTVGQLAWAVLASTRSAAWLAPLGLMGNAALVLLWAITRSVGIPFGPEAGTVETVGLLDLLATTAEIGVVALCAMSIGHHVHPWRTPRRNGCATPSSSA